MVRSVCGKVARRLLAALLVPLLGCAAAPYRFGGSEPEASLPLMPEEPQFEVGAPHRFVDGFAHYVLSAPAKVALMNWRVENHDVSPETVRVLSAYLYENGLRDVKVRINQYDPAGEWRRLNENNDVSPGWRWTLGMVSVAMYTVFPERLFGTDDYNPFTNTISIYSDVPEIALREAARAKAAALSPRKGTAAAAELVPGVSLMHEITATGDVVSYYRALSSRVDERSAYEALYPAFGSQAVGLPRRWFTLLHLPPIIESNLLVVTSLPGHVLARLSAARVPVETKPNGATAARTACSALRVGSAVDYRFAARCSPAVLRPRVPSS